MAVRLLAQTSSILRNLGGLFDNCYRTARCVARRPRDSVAARLIRTERYGAARWGSARCETSSGSTLPGHELQMSNYLVAAKV
jgi:hypothetical protein